MLGYIAAPLPSQVSSETVQHCASFDEQQLHALQKNNGMKRQIRSLTVVSIIICLSSIKSVENKRNFMQHM